VISDMSQQREQDMSTLMNKHEQQIAELINKHEQELMMRSELVERRSQDVDMMNKSMVDSSSVVPTSSTDSVYMKTKTPHWVCLSVCLSLCLSVCLSLCLSVCLSLCLYASCLLLHFSTTENPWIMK